MKRSKDVKLGLLSATAAVLIGCGQVQHRQCVDQNQVVVDDRYCQQATPYPYRWYYYGGGGMYVPYGSRASGGSYSAPSSSGTARGMFGGTGEGHGVSGGAGE